MLSKGHRYLNLNTYPFPAHIGAPQIKAHGPSIRSISACANKRTDAVFFNIHFYKGKSGISADSKPFRERNWVIGACAFIRTEFSFEKSLFFNRFVYRRMRLYARERGISRIYSNSLFQLRFSMVVLRFNSHIPNFPD